MPRSLGFGKILGIRPLAGALSSLILLACDSATAGNPSPNAELATDVVATGLDTVWELAWGPDGFIWFTERGGRISRMDPETGARTTVAQLDVAENGEGGLMGLAFHPDFALQPWVFGSHTYRTANDGTGNRIVRMRFNGTTLEAPQSILDGIPGSSIHDGSRLAIGPDRFLYVTTGDASNPSLAQDRDNLAGKVLRLTLDGQTAPGNPFGTRIYSFGHRNPQGLFFTPDGSLYVTEHGPSENDEVNRIEAGKNYGWPNVHGRCDGDIGGEQAFCAANAVVEPMAIWTPTIAPAGAAYYDNALIPAFRRSILFATLKDATLYRLALSSDGRTIEATEQLLARQFGRLRAVLVAPDGSVYLGTSNRDGRGTPMPTDDRIIRIRPR